MVKLYSTELHGYQEVLQRGPTGPQGTLGKLVFSYFSIILRISGIFWDFLSNIILFEKTYFSASPGKTMQNHLEISLKIQFWIRNVRNLTKTLTLDMSGLAETCPGGQVQTSGNSFSFQELHLSNF